MKAVNKLNDEELWKRYLIYKEWEKENEKNRISIKKFAINKKYDEQTIKNFILIYRYKYFSDKESYEKLYKISKEYLEIKNNKMIISKRKFILENYPEVKETWLSDFLRHTECIQTIEKLKKENNCESQEFYEKNKSFFSKHIDKISSKKIANQSISFLKIPTIDTTESNKIEILTQKNTIEINIKKGIIVSIEPHIDSSIIFKIINLLKEI